MIRHILRLFHHPLFKSLNFVSTSLLLLLFYSFLIYSIYQFIYIPIIRLIRSIRGVNYTKSTILSDLKLVFFVLAYLLVGVSTAFVTGIQKCRYYDSLTYRHSCASRYQSFHLSLFLAVANFVAMLEIDRKSTDKSFSRRIYKLLKLFVRSYSIGLIASATAAYFIHVCKHNWRWLSPSQACFTIDIITLIIFLYYTAERCFKERSITRRNLFTPSSSHDPEDDECYDYLFIADENELLV